MAGNGGASSSRGAGASINAAATAVGSVEPRFAPQERRSRWSGCFGGLSCFGSQKGGKRIVPASRTTDGNEPQSASLSNQNAALTLNLSLLAPPSSPASFTNSALPSTTQSPSYFLSLSANSPGGPSSSIYATGPYAHETQLVSPPLFSTYTTEPSTAPLTPPPELSHPTTPSSPEVPYARFLSSSFDLKGGGGGKGNTTNFMPYSSYVRINDFQANYPLYPGSPSTPSSSLISPASGTPRTGLSSPFPEGAPIPSRDPPYSINGSSKLFGLDSTTSTNFILSPNPSFLYPPTSAQFYLDQAQQSHTHRENKPNKTCKQQDAEEIESYRASFGFSADEIITTKNYVEIADPDLLDNSFTISPFVNNRKSFVEECPEINLTIGGQKLKGTQPTSLDPVSRKTSSSDQPVGDGARLDPSNALAGGPELNGRRFVGTCHPDRGSPATMCSASSSFHNKTSEPKFSKRVLSSGQSCSDAEIDYRRARSLRGHNLLL